MVSDGEQGLDRVEHDALGADRVDAAVQPDEQSVEVVFAGLLISERSIVDVVDEQLFVVDQGREIEPERGDVRCQIGRALLKADEDAGLAVLLDAADEELHGEQGLAAARRTADQSGTPAWEPAIGDFIQAVDATRAFQHLRERLGG